MSDEPTPPPDLANLQIDLAQSFLPAWAKQPEAPERIARMAAKFGGTDRPERERDGGRRDDRGPRQRPRPGREGGDPRNRGGKKPDRRDDRNAPRKDAPGPRPPQPLAGWEVRFIPEPRGVEGLAKQIKAGAKAYPLFDLARLVLEKSERYLVEFKRLSESAPALFQLVADGSVWPSESEAISWALAGHLDKFYRRERVTVDPPKGNYAFVAQCGMSGVLLGPPNHHDYQAKLQRLHAERFRGIPFETYKSRVRTTQDEALIQQWKEEQGSRDEFYPLETPGGTEPIKLEDLEAVGLHFREHLAPAQIVPVGGRIVVPGPAALNASAPSVLLLTRGAWEELDRFPLPVANFLGRELTARGLQIFKAHENITYVSIARPHPLDTVTTPISDALGAMLEYIAGHPSTPRPEQLKALVALRPDPESAESAVLRDLSWLLHEGHVIDYAKRGLEVARKSAPRTDAPPRNPKG